MGVYRRWISRPPNLEQVQNTHEEARSAREGVKLYLRRLSNAGYISRATESELWSAISNAIRQSEIAVVTEREYDFYEELKEQKTEVPVDLKKFKGTPITIKTTTKTTIKFEE